MITAATKRPWIRQADGVESSPRESGPIRLGRGAKEASPVLRRYFQDLGATPLLDEDNEVRLASQLRDARLAISKLAQALPESCRKIVLAGDESGPELGAAWPLAHLETFLRNLAHEATRRPTLEAAAALREIGVHKASLDDARHGLILANLRLVVHIVKKHANRGLPFLDLIQEGNLGLLRAVEKFEHERGNKFSTYAFWWIKQSVERGIMEKARTIRVPVHVNECIRKVEGSTRDLSRSLGRKPTPREIAAQLGIPEDTVEQVLSIVREPLPLEGSSDEHEGYDVAASVPDVQAASPFSQAAHREIRERVQSVLQELNAREQTIIRMRFGLGAEAARTLEQIARKLCLSRERVRQLEAVALAKIKTSPLGRDLAELFGGRKASSAPRGPATAGYAP